MCSISCVPNLCLSRVAVQLHKHLSCLSRKKLHPFLHNCCNGGPGDYGVHPPSNMRSLFVNELAPKDDAVGARVPLQEADVGDGQLAADEPFLLRQDALQHGDDPSRLVLVPLNHFPRLSVAILHEPHRLPVVRTLARGLEVHPLPHVLLVVEVAKGESVARVVFGDEVLNDSI